MTAIEKKPHFLAKKEYFQANGNTEEIALDLLSREIQMWVNGLKVRGKEVEIVNREDSIKKHNAVNYSARCTIYYHF